MKLIDKSALVAEIERLIDCCYKMCAGDLGFLQKSYPEHYYSIETYKEILSFLDTLDVKEMDFDGERREYLTEHFNVYEDGILQSKRSNLPLDTYDVIKIAKHFFELGLKVSNPTITAEQDNEWHESSVKPPFTLTMDGNRYSKPMLCYDKFGNYCIAQYARMQTGYCGWYDGYEEVSITHWKELKALKGK